MNSLRLLVPTMLLACSTSSMLHAQSIHLRDRGGVIQADRISMGNDGVRVIEDTPPVPVPDPEAEPTDSPVDSSVPTEESSPDPTGPLGTSTGRLIPWDQVRLIDDIEDPVLAADWARWQPIANDLWRARTRLQRGDRALSEPLFERHFERLIADPAGSELALIVAEGLLRSRLRSGAIEALLPAALETARLRRAGFSTDRYQDLPPVLDEQFWLVPRLAPIPTRTDLDGSSMRDSLKRWIDDPDPVVAGLARAYAMMHDAPDSFIENDLLQSATEPGASLLLSAVLTGSSDPDRRAIARDRLRSLLAAGGPLEPWRAWFIGVSELHEQSASLDSALIKLLSIPAVHLHRDPALAIRAISVSADALEHAERVDEAKVLRRELERLDFDVDPALMPDDIATDIPSSGVVPEEETR